jgi:hypothetical protein
VVVAATRLTRWRAPVGVRHRAVLHGRRGAEASPKYLDDQGAIAVDGVLSDDGSIGIKAPWWRGPGVRGLVRIEAERLDRDARPVARTIPKSGYGLTGFQATGLSLPSTGCWRVTGSVGRARLTFVTLIAEAR